MAGLSRGGNIDKSMYAGTVSVSSRAANKIRQRLADIIDNNTDCGAGTEVPRKVKISRLSMVIGTAKNGMTEVPTKLRKNIKVINGDRYSEDGGDEHTVPLRDRGKGTQINLTFIMRQ